MTNQADVLEQLRGIPHRSQAVQRAMVSFRQFVRSQVTGSVILLICALIAIVWANSPWSESYFQLWETEMGISLGQASFSLTLHEWLNEVLMMAFFLMVGLEVKEQAIVGELSSIRQALLPIGAALGGMIVPATIFLIFNNGSQSASGWGIPMSTDIAFALGILALLGKRIPLSLKVFLATLAIADDIGAIIIIALFYSGQIVISGLVIAIIFWAIIYTLGRISIYNTLLYFLLSLGVWFGLYISGIHATMAGVMVALAIPAHSLTDPRKEFARVLKHLQPHQIDGHDLLRDHTQRNALHELKDVLRGISPLAQLEHGLQPWVTFLVMPLFALANAGVVLSGSLNSALGHPVTRGVALGLLIGKPLGITLFSWLMVRLRVARLPQSLSWAQVQGASILAGIGFTMSLFVTELAFKELDGYTDMAKTGILIASLLAGVIGYTVLHFVCRPNQNELAELASKSQPAAQHG